MLLMCLIENCKEVVFGNEDHPEISMVVIVKEQQMLEFLGEDCREKCKTLEGFQEIYQRLFNTSL